MTTISNASLSFAPLTATLGAEIVGLERSRLTAAARSALRAAWVRYHVLVLRGQPMDEEAQIDFARSFGAVRGSAPGSGFKTVLTDRPEIMVISNIKHDGTLQGLLSDGEMEWHFDGIHQPTPYYGAVLHGIEVPSAGGQTRFKNMCEVYRTLPEATRARLDGLTARSAYDYNATNREENLSSPASAKGIHPVVRVHEESGEKALYVCRLMTDRIMELPESESAALLDELFDHTDACDATYQHEWRAGDTVIWDNRCVTHARNDFDPNERRFMKRVTIVAP